VGFYPHGVHVHLDVERAEDTYWVDAGPPAADPAITLAPAPLDTAPDTAEADSAENEEIDLPTIPQPLPPPPATDPALSDDGA
jgi:hypothetical protein